MPKTLAFLKKKLRRRNVIDNYIKEAVEWKFASACHSTLFFSSLLLKQMIYIVETINTFD